MTANKAVIADVYGSITIVVPRAIGTLDGTTKVGGVAVVASGADLNSVAH